ncbi:hypothetical protein QTP86_002291 [Hemibagrus guttatus]|nr:hypothetical protein QTP86_002291 [Hemibagrus guttatus]
MLWWVIDKYGRNWDLLLTYVVFAIQEVPQASTGFTPFELLFRQQPQGLLDMANEIWEEHYTTPWSTISKKCRNGLTPVTSTQSSIGTAKSTTACNSQHTIVMDSQGASAGWAGWPQHRKIATANHNALNVISTFTGEKLFEIRNHKHTTQMAPNPYKRKPEPNTYLVFPYTKEIETKLTIKLEQRCHLCSAP